MANQGKASNKKHGRYIVQEYTVIEFDEESYDERMFECIPNTWFVDESKQQTYWPPKSGSKTVMHRAVNCDRPDPATWNIYDCKVVRGGFRRFLYLFC